MGKKTRKKYKPQMKSFYFLMLLLSTYRQGGIIMGECNRSHREDFQFKMQYLSNPKRD